MNFITPESMPPLKDVPSSTLLIWINAFKKVKPKGWYVACKRMASVLYFRGDYYDPGSMHSEMTGRKSMTPNRHGMIEDNYSEGSFP